MPPYDELEQADEIEALEGELVRVMTELDTSHAEHCDDLQATADGARELGYRPLLAKVKVGRGRCAEAKGDYEESVTYLQDGLFIAIGGHDDMLALQAASRVSTLLSARLGHLKEARPWLRQAEALAERLGGDDEVMSIVLNVKGTLALLEGDLEIAREAFEAALAGKTQTFGEHHSSVAKMHNNIAIVHARLGRMDGVISGFEAAYRGTREHLGVEHPDSFLIAMNLGSAYLQGRHLAKATALLEETLSRREALVGREHVDVASILIALAGVNQRAGLDDGDPAHFKRARAQLERALEVRERSLGMDSPKTAFVLTALGELHSDSGEPELALPRLRRALALYTAAGETGTPNIANVLSRLGRAFLELGDSPQALSALTEAMLVHEGGASQPEELAFLRFSLARTLILGGRKVDRPRARQHAEAAMAAYLELGTYKHEVAKIRAWLLEHP